MGAHSAHTNGSKVKVGDVIGLLGNTGNSTGAHLHYGIRQKTGEQSAVWLNPQNYFTVDANALPDGRYIFKVVATDAPSNPANLALSDELETESVDVDNTSPSVTADAPRVSGTNVEVTFRASDTTSIIKRAEYQLDGGAWKTIFPLDGIADSKREEFLVKITLPDSRSHVVAFRAFDANSNVGSAQVNVK